VSSRPRFVLTFLAWASDLSGGYRHLLEVASRWREHVDVAVCVPPQALPTVHTFLGEVPAYELGSAASRQARLGPLLALEYLRRTVSVTLRRPPSADVVLAASHFTTDAAGLAALARRGAFGVSYAYHLIAHRRGFRPRTLWSKYDERVGLALLRRFAGIVFVSNASTSSALAQRGFNVERTAVGVDLASFDRAVPQSLPPHGAFVARMTHTKGVVDAVEAWRHVQKAVPEAKLVMVGDGPERPAARARAERLGISDSVEWRGFVSEDEKRRILTDSRVLLAPSYEEGWGISVCEAMATAVPVVAYRLPVLDELFGSAYLGANVGDVAGLAKLAVDVLTDDSSAEAFSRRGREASERYDVERVAEQELEAILRQWRKTATP
jgi:glycosyltransferase involved in cell wall biosynthesis